MLTAVAPRVMARQEVFRRAPRAALLGWQSVSLAALIAAVSAAPLAVHVLVLEGSGWARWAAVPALVLSGLVLGRLLWSGHLVGTRLRAARREHRLLVDALGEAVDEEVRVLAHPTPTAYCLPGLRRRVVLTEGTLRTLPADQLDAVLAHERAHLRERHDLVLEFFTVLHQSAPARLQAPEALREVRLLVEVLADRAARRAAGPVPLARALVALAGASHPDTALAATADVGATRTRMALLAQDDAPRWLAPVVYAFAAGVLAAPLALVGLALGSMGA
ncbi:M56 family metallopeptidase [Knoellia sp. 3-2P3]|uniref:M56 family metallopeptidase n=1 Tax=unclassified Knoellia TaxID=2618719 RepID=UPI0023D98FE3|nr:M56 family metallopeptidase [Knoellia sp. 3-2P3]MDF2091165.1 M56 family metallopeptidase [Knoellia sp. 3-2P3]